MKKIYLKKVFLLVAFIALLQSCKNDECPQDSQDGKTIGVQKETQKVQNLLTSSANGWKVTYFTDAEHGGFTYLFNFVSDTRVKMESDDFSEKSATSTGEEDITTSESGYRIVPGSKVKLSISKGTKNDQLSNSDTHQTNDSKEKGGFEFVYDGQEGEDLIFTTNPYFMKLRFKKATEDDWKDHHLIKENKEMMSHMIEADKLFKTLKVGGDLYSLSYDKKLRFVKGLSKSSGQEKQINFGVAFTPTGIIINPAIKVDGKEIKSFTYNDTDKKFIAKINGIEQASIYSDNNPLFLPHYDFNGRNPIRYNLMTGSAFNKDISSTEFKNLFNSWKQKFKQEVQGGKELKSIYISFKQLRSEDALQFLYILIKEGTQFPRPWFGFTYTITQDNETGTDIIKFTPTGNNDPKGMEQQLKSITDFFFRDKGFYMYQTGELQTNSSVKKIGLIPVDDGRSLLIDFYESKKKN